MSDGPSRIERQAYKWLLKMLEDPGRHAPALERWLARDPERRAVYKRVAVEVGRASDSAARIPELRTIVSPVPKRVLWGPKGKMVAVSGLIAVAATVYGILGTPSLIRREFNPGQHIAGGRSYAAANSDRIVVLEDGSKVTLFAGSGLATHFTKDERSVDLLRGRARFAVFHNAARPFVVYAAGGKVTATGTLFEVTIADGVKVRLISGAVEVTLPPPMKERSGKIVHLGPGQQVSYAPDGEAVPPPAAQRSAPESEHTAESFDDVPAADIVEKVNRTSAIKIVFADAAIGKRKVLAEFNIEDPQAVAQKLATLLGMVVDRTKPDRLVLKTPD